MFTSSRSSTSIQSALIPLTRYHGYFHGKRSLEVDHGYNGASDLEVAPQTVPEVYHNQYTDSDQKLPYPQDTPQKTPVERGRFCGVRPLIFWILIFAIVIILAAGLGGGLGAGLSSKNSNKSSDSASRLVYIHSARISFTRRRLPPVHKPISLHLRARNLPTPHPPRRRHKSHPPPHPPKKSPAQRTTPSSTRPQPAQSSPQPIPLIPPH